MVYWLVYKGCVKSEVTSPIDLAMQIFIGGLLTSLTYLVPFEAYGFRSGCKFPFGVNSWNWCFGSQNISAYQRDSQGTFLPPSVLFEP
jgi:hypothetical protein